MKKILILCPYPQGVAAGQRFKYEQYLNSWKEQGYQVEISSFFDMNIWNILYEESNLLSKFIGTIKGYCRRIRDIFLLKNYEIVYIFMWVTPIGTSLFEWVVSKLSKNLVYDFDDAIFLDTENTSSKRLNYLRGSKTKKSRYLISTADHVILSSPFHLDYCQKHNKKNAATYIPCSIDTKRFSRKKTENNKKIVLGWTGTFSSIPYLDLLKDVLMDLNKSEQFKVLLITNFDYSLSGIDLDVVKWNKDTEIEDLHKIDVGLYPLSIDQWSLGKGGLKVLQYMSIGIPSVATNYGTACDIITHGETGFLVSEKAQWISVLKNLINNPELRDTIGKNARERTVKKYSLEQIQSKYLKVLNSL
ncbi:MAG: glycosyltransferase family 4 protein [Pseudomonadota bacterium]|nr:glycosyltransferase family 4 protein [Pseudomonadota bacterium]